MSCFLPPGFRRAGEAFDFGFDCAASALTSLFFCLLPCKSLNPPPTNTNQPTKTYNPTTPSIDDFNVSHSWPFQLTPPRLLSRVSCCRSCFCLLLCLDRPLWCAVRARQFFASPLAERRDLPKAAPSARKSTKVFGGAEHETVQKISLG